MIFTNLDKLILIELLIMLPKSQKQLRVSKNRNVTKLMSIYNRLTVNSVNPNVTLMTRG